MFTMMNIKYLTELQRIIQRIKVNLETTELQCVRPHAQNQSNKVQINKDFN